MDTQTETIDGAELINRRVNALLAKYPADSLTPREVIANLPCANEIVAQKINTIVTKVVYDKALEFAARVPKVASKWGMRGVSDHAEHKRELERLTQDVVDLVTGVERNKSEAR